MATQNTCRVVRFHESGDAHVLKIDSVQVREPEAHEVRINVHAIGINRAEIMFRNNAYLYSPSYPSTLGYEASGVVEAIGSAVTEFKIGDRVSTIPAFSMNTYGTYGEKIVMPVSALAPCPKAFDMLQSAAIWMSYVTAYGALVHYGNVKKGQYVLVTAASSSVGISAIQLAKYLGATVIAVTRGESKKQDLLDAGADFVVTTNTEDLVSRVSDITANQGVDLAFDPIGGPLLGQLAEVAKMHGTIIEYGALAAEPTAYPLLSALSKGLVIRGYTLFELTEDKAQLEVAKAYLMPLFEAKALVPKIDKTFDFSDIQSAHLYMESNQQFGKIVVSVVEG